MQVSFCTKILPPDNSVIAIRFYSLNYIEITCGQCRIPIKQAIDSRACIASVMALARLMQYGRASIRRAVLVRVLPFAFDHGGLHVVVGIYDGITRTAVSDLEVDDIFA
jgi:hypothetical protein